MSKFLQNLPVQFSKVLPNPKFKRNLKRIFFFYGWPGSSFQLDGLLCPPLPLGCHPLSARSLLPSHWAAVLAPLMGLSLPAGPGSQSPLSSTHWPYPIILLPKPLLLPHVRVHAASWCPFRSRNGRSTPPHHSPPPPRSIPY
jgi:hypothetical protein